MRMLVVIVILTMSVSVKAQRLSGVSLAHTPSAGMVYLHGTSSYDPKSANYISVKWFLYSGTVKTINIVSPDSASTKVTGLVVGSYRFGFVVNDRRLKLADTSYTMVTVRK